MQPQNPNPMQNPLSVMQNGEECLCEIKRHPIGMLGLYIMSGLLLIALAVVAFGVAPHYIISAPSSKVLGIGSVAYLVFLVFTVGFLAIANKVYWGNRWILTSDSLTQIQQTSLFDKQSSQLSLANLEDVTSEQNGILTHMFNFGVLRVETAGERSKFMFLYCPRPTVYAQQILQAREAFEQHLRTSEGGAAPAPSAPAQPGVPPIER